MGEIDIVMNLLRPARPKTLLRSRRRNDCADAMSQIISGRAAYPVHHRSYHPINICTSKPLNTAVSFCRWSRQLLLRLQRDHSDMTVYCSLRTCRVSNIEITKTFNQDIFSRRSCASWLARCCARVRVAEGLDGRKRESDVSNTSWLAWVQRLADLDAYTAIIFRVY